VKRLCRILLNALTALSLILFVATVALWVRTAVGPQVDLFTTISATRSYGLGTEHGGRIIGFLQQERPSYRADDPADIQLGRGGFRYLRITSRGMRRWNLVLPLWSLTGVAAAMPATRLATRRRRRPPGLCVKCGYDLRATPERCPECGRAARTAP
jgi:hypothetical protein